MKFQNITCKSSCTRANNGLKKTTERRTPKAALPKPFRFLPADSLLRLQRTGHAAHSRQHRHRAPRFCWQPGLGKEDEEVLCQEPSPSGTLPWVLKEPLDALFHPEAFKPLPHTSGSVNGNRQFGTRTFFCSFSWTCKTVLLKKIIQIRWMQK